jgi:hypothetical protein
MAITSGQWRALLMGVEVSILFGVGIFWCT